MRPLPKAPGKKISNRKVHPKHYRLQLIPTNKVHKVHTDIEAGDRERLKDLESALEVQEMFEKE